MAHATGRYRGLSVQASEHCRPYTSSDYGSRWYRRYPPHRSQPIPITRPLNPSTSTMAQRKQIRIRFLEMLSNEISQPLDVTTTIRGVEAITQGLVDQAKSSPGDAAHVTLTTDTLDNVPMNSIFGRTFTEKPDLKPGSLSVIQALPHFFATPPDHQVSRAHRSPLQTGVTKSRKRSPGIWFCNVAIKARGRLLVVVWWASTPS